MSEIMIDSKAKADKELQVIASRFRELGYTPNVDLKSDGSGYEFNSKPYMTTATDERGQRRFKAESDLRKDFAAMMNDDNKPLHYLFKKRYRVSFISDPVDLLGELNKNPKYIMCCFPNCVIFVTVNSSPQSIYGIGSDRVQTKRYVDLIDAALKNKNSSTSVNVKEYIIRGRYASIDQHLFSVLWCPIICSNIDDNLKDIDGRKDIKEFPYSRQSLFKYFTHLVGSADKELPYIDVKDFSPKSGSYEFNNTYLHEIQTDTPVKVPKIKWYKGGQDFLSWSLDLITDWWIWDGQSDFKDNSQVVDEVDTNALSYTLRIYDGGQEFYLEPDWKPTADDESAAGKVKAAGERERTAAEAVTPALASDEIKKRVAAAEDKEADSHRSLRRRYLNRLYEFRNNRAPPSKDCSGYWHGRENKSLDVNDIYCTIDTSSRNFIIKFFKTVATPAVGERRDERLTSGGFADLPYPSDPHPLCGGIQFKPLAAGDKDGDEKVRYGVLFTWNSRRGWTVKLESDKTELVSDGVEYILYRTPLGVRAYQK